MAVGIYVLHLHPGEEEIRRTFLREAAECVDPVRRKKTERLKGTGAKAASLGAGMLLQKMAMDLTEGVENTDILFLEEDELLAVLQERMHRDKAGAILFLRIWRTGEATDREYPEKIQSVSFRRLCGLRGRRRRSGSGHSEMGSL